MGTYYKVSINSASDRDFHPKIMIVLEKVNQEMSTYIEDSLISQFNRHPVNTWFEVSDSFMDVFSKSIEICNLSNGYFDVTVGKVVDAWGFGPLTEILTPDSLEMEEALSHVSCNAVIQDKKDNYLKKINPVSLDFSAIAKGYAVDELAILLLSDPAVKGFMIDVGGELQINGRKDKNLPWSVGISHPYKIGLPIYKVPTEKLNNFAMATSGDYRNFREIKGNFVTHTIDLKQGKPRPLLITSVSVISETAIEADALATALNAMGSKKGLSFANQNNISAIFVSREEEKFKLEFSNNFKNQVQ